MPSLHSIKRTYTSWLLAGIIGYFLYLMIPWLNNDLWNDEIYTLIHFTLVHFKTTLTDYHVPNNHIFYNVFDHFWLKLAGISNLRLALEHAWVLRLPLLFLSVGTLLLQYKTGKLAGGKLAGLLSAAILATTIPFQNFCLQVRGYPFSIFFDLLLVYNCLQYTLHQRRVNLIWMVVSAAAAVYTIPSNLYCTVGVIAFLGVEWMRKTIKLRTFDTTYFKPALAVLAGICIALVCYSPVFKQVFANDYVRSVSPPLHSESASMLPVFYNEIIAGQIELYILFIVCSVLYFVLPLSPGQTQTGKIWKLLLWIFITPVVMIALRGENPPTRVFIYLSPFVALLIGVTIAWVIRIIPGSRLRLAAGLMLLVYLVFACQRERKTVAGLMNEYLRTEQRPQDLRTDYYLHNFHPLRVAKYIERQESIEKVPVIIKSSEPHDIPHYLEALDIPYHPGDSLDYYLGANRKVFVITMFPHEFQGDFAEKHKAVVQEVLPPAYHHLMEISLQ